MMKSEPGPHVSRITKIMHPALVAAVALVCLTLAVGFAFAPGSRQLPEFDAMEDTSARKQAFFEFLAPLVEKENARVLLQRQRLLEHAERIRSGKRIGWLDRRWLGRLAEEYEALWLPDDPQTALAMLERRVDAVPISLALVQAATESGWGRSRFAVEGNNLFGHWCYRRGCGLVPERRNSGAAHEVAAFDSITQSVARYLHNLNTHIAYAPLRAIRARLRSAGEPLTAMALADGLVLYSERREDYVDEIKTVIRINRPIIEKVRETL